MTSAGILPSTGPPPPELQRPYIPAHLRPDLPDAKEKLLEGRKPEARATSGEAGQTDTRRRRPSAITLQAGPDKPAAAAQTGLTNAGRNLGGTAAIQVQINESLVGAAAEAEALAPPLEPLESPGDLSAQPKLTDEDLAEIARLAARDREVRAHEAAHSAAGQGYTGATAFDYVRGPDGLQYAVGGHVDIDVREIHGNPRATISKMEVVQRAALAPARPSGQDRAVAAAAAARIRDAERQLAGEREAAANGAPKPAGIDLVA